MTTPLQVNDPVHVERGDSQQLEGIVAYLGKVQFAEGDDWVGVRLTGTSVGLGKNDGSVQGVAYFSCGPNGGVFVRRSHVSPRELSKLETLRLKRELAKKSATTAGAAASGIKSPKPAAATASSTRTPRTTPSSSASRIPTPTSSSTRSPTRTATSSTTKMTKTTGSSTSSSASSSVVFSPSKQSRMDEIRARRAALAEKQKAGSLSAAPTAATTTAPQQPQSEPTVVTSSSPTSPSSAESVAAAVVRQEEVDALRAKIDQLSEQLQNKEEECTSLQQSLSKANQDVVGARKQVETLQEPKDEQQQGGGSRDDMDSELLQQTRDKCRDVEEQLQEARATVETQRKDLTHHQKQHQVDVEQLTQVRAELSALRHEFQQMSDQSSHRMASDATHYKERAKLQAELSASKRQVEQLEKEKMDLESVLEDVTLDKEQLQEEKEAMEDRLEELKVDAETAQMETEELRSELEIAKEAAEGGGGGTAASHALTGGTAANVDADDVARGLTVQNARLREALIRLREQSTFEKMELSRQLRSVEKDAANVTTLTEEVERLRDSNKRSDEEIRDLKEMVDQGSAFESMVESLSDRVLLLEDDNTALQSTIRELEEAAEITAEMEEVQAEENKTLMRDLEGRDANIRILEEAIRMQRRREEDFQRTIGNYRKSVEMLKEEKKALMAFQETGEGEKGDLLATSQKALARAAQLVADASIARKREAEAVFDRIDADVQRHLSERLEILLPENVASSEIASIKGELLLSRVVGKASKTLEGMASVFEASIRSGMDLASSEGGENMAIDEVASFQLADESRQSIVNMIHQGDVAILTIGLSSDLLKLLSAGQWPDLLSPEVSSDLGATAGNSIAELDVVLGDQLRRLKEDRVLSSHTSNIGAFKQTIQTTMQSLHTSLEVDNSPIVSRDWSPPGWTMLKDVSIAKYSCMCAGAVVASVVSPDDTTTEATDQIDPKVYVAILPLMSKLDQIATEATKACHRLARLDLRKETLVLELSELSVLWKTSSLSLIETIRDAFSGKNDLERDDFAKCRSAAETTMRELARFSSALRAAKLIADTDQRFHPLSPEAKDAWEGIASLAQTVRSVDGDADDVNHLVRARALEYQLRDGVENGPKLSLAKTKISSLEKSLATRSKEIAMQNARISELEKVLAKSSSIPSPRSIKSSELSASEEMNALKEENRVLTEAMDVLHRQVDDYENEIRSLKDFKSPKSAQRRSSMSSRASPFVSPGMSANRRGTPATEAIPDASAASIGAMEAVLLRPALESVRQDASRFRAQAVATALDALPPLDVLTPISAEEAKHTGPLEEVENLAKSLSEARSQVRLNKASITVVDLSRTDKSPRQALMESKAKTYGIETKLADAVAAAERYLRDYQGVSVALNEPRPLVGKVKIAGDGSVSVPLTVDKSALNRLHRSMLR